MEILHEFGINPVLLVAQIINFAIVFWVLKKFLYKPILTMLKERQKEIKKGITDAEDARVLLEKTTQKEKEVLKKAQAESLTKQEN
jgi:F-type H+-transporting ATPase subunit b